MNVETSKEFWIETGKWISLVGAVSFGAVVGWMAHHVFQEAKNKSVEWLGTMLAVIGGGAVTKIFDPDGTAFGAYCIGLGFLFFARVISKPITDAVREQMDIMEQEKLRKLKKEMAAAQKREADGHVEAPPKKQKHPTTPVPDPPTP